MGSMCKDAKLSCRGNIFFQVSNGTRYHKRGARWNRGILPWRKRFGSDGMSRESTGRLFDEPEDEQSPAMETQDGSAAAPLAERMRPRTLEEFVGQAGLVGSESLLAYVAQVAVEIPRISRESRRHGGWVFTTKCGLG